MTAGASTTTTANLPGPFSVSCRRTSPLCSSSSCSRNFSCRWKSSRAELANAARDQRLAGRKRFYVEVDVQAVPAPWESVVQTNEEDNEDENKKDANNKSSDSVASPISAGVDGTGSASGVFRRAPTPSQEEERNNLLSALLPRRPGTPFDLSTALVASQRQEDANKWYGVALDGRLIRTPAGQKLAVPSLQLATAIAVEWDQQPDTIKPTQMPLMTLSCTVLDQTSQEVAAQAYREQSLNFLSTDTVCYWADPTEDRVMHKRQQEAWKDLHSFVEAKYGHKPATAWGTVDGMLLAKNNAQGKGLPHAVELKESAAKWVNSLDGWHLTILHSIAAEAKSFWIAWALLNPHQQQQDENIMPFRDIAHAIEAARVEEEFQISQWGLVEGQHDYDRLNCSVQLTAAVLLKDCLAIDCQI